MDLQTVALETVV